MRLGSGLRDRGKVMVLLRVRNTGRGGKLQVLSGMLLHPVPVPLWALPEPGPLLGLHSAGLCPYFSLHSIQAARGGRRLVQMRMFTAAQTMNQEEQAQANPIPKLTAFTAMESEP